MERSKGKSRGGSKGRYPKQFFQLFRNHGVPLSIHLSKYFYVRGYKGVLSVTRNAQKENQSHEEARYPKYVA